MKKIMSVILTFSMLSPAYGVEIEERGGVKIPSKEEIKATKRFQEIKEWKDVKAKKGYILSNDLYYVQKCSPTWDIHVKEFKKENPHIKDPNVLSIGQTFKVQTCFAQEVVEVVKEEAPVAPAVVQEAKKEEKQSDFFALVSGQLNKSNDGNDNSASKGAGVKLEVGKYFPISEDRKVKVSAGVLFNKTSLDNTDEETKKVTGTLDASYLFKVNEKLSVGPNVEIFTGPGFHDVKNKADRLAGFAGVNLDYSLNKRFSLDLKVQNALESRLNLNTTFGLGINF